MSNTSSIGKLNAPATSTLKVAGRLHKASSASTTLVVATPPQDITSNRVTGWGAVGAGTVISTKSIFIEISTSFPTSALSNLILGTKNGQKKNI